MGFLKILMNIANGSQTVSCGSPAMKTNQWNHTILTKTRCPMQCMGL